MREKSDLHIIHKNIYLHMKRKALSFEGELPEDIKKYQKDQKRFSERNFETSSLHELFKSIEKSKVIYLGDFHTFDQNSRNLQRLIKTLIRNNKNLTLGVEFVHQDHQIIIEEYLQNNISEMEFLESINYQDSWRFPWGQYKVFFELARKNGINILALNTKGTLKERDLNAAEVIADYVKNNPEKKMLVLFGEFHIVPDKLPLNVSIKIGTLINQTIIHQNLDSVFWKLKSSHNNNGQIIKFSENEFTIQTSPPWIKYESMNYWYENLLDDPDFDVHESIMETGKKRFTSNTNDNFVFICNKILTTFGIDIEKNILEDFNLYDHTSLEYIIKILNKLKKPAVVNFYKKLVQRGKIFKIPFQNTYYCPNYSINRLSYMAGVHIHNIMIRRTDEHFETVISSNSQMKKFLFFFYKDIMAYMSSKAINPYRKCDLYLDIKKKLETETKSSKIKYISLSLKILDSKSSLSDSLKGCPLKHLSSAAKLVAYLIGDMLYDHYFDKNPIFFGKYKKLILSNDLDELKFFNFKNAILTDDSYKTQKKRIF